MPFWILGENDPYPLASSAAKSSLQNAFPGPKRCQVLNFCKESIVQECADILYCEKSYKLEASSSKDDPESNSATEMKLNRLFSSSLQSLTSLLNELGDEDTVLLTDLIRERYLNQTKFWNVGKNKNSAVFNFNLQRIIFY